MVWMVRMVGVKGRGKGTPGSPLGISNACLVHMRYLDLNPEA